MQRIESVKNERVKRWKKLHTKKGRKQQNAFLIEGPHLIEEALKEENVVIELIRDERVSFPASWEMDQIFVYEVTNKIMKELSETESNQGLMAVCRLPKRDCFLVHKGKYVLIDRLQDPGNVGTIIRTADSAGFDAVILGKGSVDPFNSKVVRATQGSLFHLPVIQKELQEVIHELKALQIPLYGTARKGTKDYRAGANQASFALLVGNEGAGVSECLLNVCDEILHIPIYGQAESLNVAVAAGILMYALRE